MKDRSGAEGFIQHAAKMKLFTFSTIVHKIDAGTAIPAGKNSALRWGEVEFRVDRGMVSDELQPKKSNAT
jgi:hypothetical protein